MLQKTMGSLKGQKAESEEELMNRCRKFLMEELALFFWGLILTIIVAGILMVRILCTDHSIILFRNSFGEGQKKQELLLKNKEERKSVSVTIEEQEITEEEINTLFDRCFKELKTHMCGKNKSLDQVSQPLRFDDQLADYPFEISYQPEDLSLIGLGGQPGEEAEKLHGSAAKKTQVEVTASYGKWEKTRTYQVTLVAPGRKKNISLYDQALAQLTRLEEQTRTEKEIILPEEIGSYELELPGTHNMEYSFLFLVMILPLFLIFHRYYGQKELTEKKRREAVKDFPVIVHLLTLYMKAGSSFSSAIHRVSAGYLETLEEKGNRRAFDEIVRMDRQMQMGVSQKEACMDWGSRSSDSMYRKLSVTLVQLLSKGSKEADRILEDLEKDAFDQRVDRARKAGKETETKLLFPMIVLLCLVMVIVLFPAVVQFQGF